MRRIKGLTFHDPMGLVYAPPVREYFLKPFKGSLARLCRETEKHLTSKQDLHPRSIGSVPTYSRVGF